MENFNNYFNLRNVNDFNYQNYKIPKYLAQILPSNKNAKILDIGCGFGFFLRELKKGGYLSIKGIDLSNQAIDFCLSQGLEVQRANIIDFAEQSAEKYELIVMSHVLEHIKKDEIIFTLKRIRNNLLDANGKLCLMVPNAQSNTGSYWAYEDFTHTTLFTTGSIHYVLKAAGFNNIKFLDPNGTENSNIILKLIKNTFLPLYKMKKKFWNKITSSSFHRQSPEIFTFELKVLASSE